MPQFTQDRYIKQKITSPFEIWNFKNQKKSISNKKILRVEVGAEAVVHWTDDKWKTLNKISTKYTGLGIHVADINFKNNDLTEIKFTFFWAERNDWENKDFEVKIASE